MSWFKRITRGITTTTKEKKETPEGLWYKCQDCKHVVSTDEHNKNLWVCEKCSYHDKISAEEYFSIFFDNDEYEEFNTDIRSADPLNFEDTKKYTDRVAATIKKTGLSDAMRTAIGNVEGQTMVCAAMDFAFIGGSMGSVMGEKIAKAIDRAIEEKCAFMIISKSGGARMMEAGFSLMQMAKTSAKLIQLADYGWCYRIICYARRH